MEAVAAAPIINSNPRQILVEALRNLFKNKNNNASDSAPIMQSKLQSDNSLTMLNSCIRRPP